MAPDFRERFLAELDAVLISVETANQARRDLGDESALEARTAAASSTAIARAQAAVERITGPASTYSKQIQAHNADPKLYLGARLDRIAGVVSGLRADVAAGSLSTMAELIHGDVFADFIEFAAYLLDEVSKDVATVVIGGVLESHLRQLCCKNGIPADQPNGKWRKASQLNDDLKAAAVYGQAEWRQVSAWLDLRNHAAHADYGKYDAGQVRLFIEGLRGFILKYPA